MIGLFKVLMIVKLRNRNYFDEILSFIKQYKSDLFTVSDNSVTSHSDNQVYELSKFESSPLELISYLAGDDFCLLKKSADDYLLAAASVCTPTYWELSEKMGKPMKQVHAPIANLEEKIGRMIRHFFINLKPDDYYQRSNWFFTFTPELPLFIDSDTNDINFDELNTSNILDKLYLRCERQSFRKLKQTEYIVFGIKIYVSPLNIVRQHSELAEDLILGLDSMTAAQKDLMVISPYEDILLESLNQVLSN